MNEKIKQFAEQSRLLGPTSRIGNSHEAAERFAELIVQECAEIAIDVSEGLTVATAIRKHFGVE